jgi:biopolymer transport protein ExbB
MHRQLGRLGFGLTLFCGLAVLLAIFNKIAIAADTAPTAVVAPTGPKMMSLSQLFEAGGAIGYVITALSVLMVSLIVEHIFSLRRNALIPPGLAESVHHHVALRHFEEARQQCHFHPSFLAYVLSAGLREADIGYGAVEKGLEDSATEQAARLYRKIEYLSVIGTIAPMLGLLGTVWGMILAFMEFEQKANPQVSELAPGIYKALVTTLQGLCVAIPALAAFAHFRNRIDQLVADGALTAEAVFSDYKRMELVDERADRPKPASATRSKPSTDLPILNPTGESIPNKGTPRSDRERPLRERPERDRPASEKGPTP